MGRGRLDIQHSRSIVGGASGSAVLTGLGSILHPNPAMNRWAAFGRPAGTTSAGAEYSTSKGDERRVTGGEKEERRKAEGGKVEMGKW